MCPEITYLEADDEREPKDLNEMDVEYIEVQGSSGGQSPHIWIQDRHFTYADDTNPSADEVEEGQVFYDDAGGVREVYEIIDIDHSVPTNQPGVTYRYIYVEGGSPDEIEFGPEQVPMDVITGLASAESSSTTIGYAGPPIRLREIH